MMDVRNNPAHWPSVPEWDAGCSADEGWSFSGSIYRPICRPRTASDASIINNFRYYEDAQIQRQGGDLGYWQATTAPVIVSGGGDPAYHGQYNYAGHYWGYPFYQLGNKYLFFGGGAWSLVDADIPYPVYTGSGALDYPWLLTHWISAFGTVTNVPTFSRGAGGSEVAIPRWPVNSPVPPGPQPWQPGFYQNDDVYRPFAGYAEANQVQSPFLGNPLETMFQNQPAASQPVDYSSWVENPRPAPGVETYVDTVDANGNPVAGGIVQTLGSALHTLEASVSDAVGGDGTIFGFSPLMVLAAAGVGLWLMSKK